CGSPRACRAPARRRAGGHAGRRKAAPGGTSSRGFPPPRARGTRPGAGSGGSPGRKPSGPAPRASVVHVAHDRLAEAARADELRARDELLQLLFHFLAVVRPLLALRLVDRLAQAREVERKLLVRDRV